MKQDEIIKSLTCCSVGENCKGCLFDTLQSPKCVTEMAKNALQLIEQQQAEIKQLQARLENSVELPCEIGSTVYVTMNRGLKTDVVPGTVRNVLRDSNNIWWLVFSDLWVDINFEDFGKKVFLTEAEAEQALAERKNNG